MKRDVIRHLGRNNAALIKEVGASLLYKPPVAVVVPVAIYQ
jgi:hypothetical protein